MFFFATKSKHAVLLWAPMAMVLALFAGQARATPIVPGFNANTLAPTDDGFAGPVNPGFTLHFFNKNYDHLFINNNGNITFDRGSTTFTPSGMSNPSTTVIAPFFADVDTSHYGNPVTYGSGTFGGHNAFGVNWQQVAGYGLGSDLLDSFQLLLVDRADTGAGNFDLYFNYGSISWDTGALSGTSAIAGYGTGIAGTYYEVTGSATPGAFVNGGPNALVSATNDNVPGQIRFQFRSGGLSPFTLNRPVEFVPEPGTAALFALGLLCLAGLRRRSEPHFHM